MIKTEEKGKGRGKEGLRRERRTIRKG